MLKAASWLCVMGSLDVLESGEYRTSVKYTGDVFDRLVAPYGPSWKTLAPLTQERWHDKIRMRLATAFDQSVLRNGEEQFEV